MVNVKAVGELKNGLSTGITPCKTISGVKIKFSDYVSRQISQGGDLIGATWVQGKSSVGFTYFEKGRFKLKTQRIQAMLRRDPTTIKLSSEDIKEFTREQRYKMISEKTTRRGNNQNEKDEGGSKDSEDKRSEWVGGEGN